MLLFILIQPLGPLHFLLKLLISISAFFLLTIYSILKSNLNSRLVIIALLLPVLIAIIYFHAFDLSSTWDSFPSNISAVLAIFAGYMQKCNIRFIRIINPLFWILIISVYCFWGNRAWHNWNSFGVVKFEVDEHVPAFFGMNASSKTIFTLDSLNNHISIFDFWNTSCGVCFEKFPLLDSLQRKYEGTGMKFYAVNVPLNRDKPGKADSMINEYNYSFQKINFTSSALADSFKIRVYPTTLAIDQNRRIIYRGSIDELGHFLQTFRK